MTQSSPCTEGMIETRKSMVRPFEAQLEAPVLRNPLLGDVELGHDLDAADHGLMMALVDRLHRLVEDTVDAVLDDDFALTRLDVDVARPPLDGVEDRRVDELDDRARVMADAVDRQHFIAVVVLTDTSCSLKSSVASSRTRWALSERCRISLIPVLRPDPDLDRLAEQAARARRAWSRSSGSAITTASRPVSCS